LKGFYFILLCFISLPGFAQELPAVINFDPNIYEAGNQNWMISQASNKNLYIANGSGLLEYNGAQWHLYPIPNNTIVRSVKAVGNKIFTGAYMEIGYWMKNSKGVLEYTSLIPQIPGGVQDGEEFWHMEYMGEVLVFHSFEGLYLYNLKTLEISRVNTPAGVIKNLFTGVGTVYFQVMTQGLFTVKNNKTEIVIPQEELGNIEIMHVSQRDNFLQLIGRNVNFYKWDGKELIRNNLELSEKLQNQSVFTAVSLDDNSLLLGTVEQGIYHIDKNGEILLHFNQKNGLLNNTVLDLFVDEDNNVWAGLDNGLSVINQDSPFMLYQDNYGNLGSVYASFQTDEFLYLGTNQGLFFKRKNEDFFNFMKGTNGQVWSLQLVDNNLFCGHNNGTYLIKGDVATRIFDHSGTWVVKNYEGMPGYYLQGHYDGISLLREENGKFNSLGMVENFHLSSKFIVSEKDGDIWTVNDHQGIYRIQLDFPQTLDGSIENYSFREISGINSSIFKFNDTLYYSAKEQLFQFQEKENKFMAESSLGTIFKNLDLVSGKLINTGNNLLWGFLEDAVFSIEVAQLSNSYKISKVHLPKDLRNITLGYENINLLDKNSYLLGVSNGYLKFDRNFTRNLEYEIKIDRILISVLDGSPEVINLNDSPSFNYKSNNITFEYNIPEYKKFISPVYRYRLLGLSSKWVAWSGIPAAEFENLAFGDYEFQVRGQIGENLTNTESFKFRVDRPWFFGYPALGVYMAFILFLAVLVHKAYERNHNKIIEQNEKALKMKNLEAEQIISKLQNEQLEMDITNKNKELAVSTMSLIRKNEFLTNIKDQLKESGSSKIISVIKTIDKDINEEDNWNYFKEAFNNADKDFFKKIKALHPKLTPNDLKLCAYLRLNLSSKEIGPLLNISVKSVEIKRYRLRKKMDLDREANLTLYILNI